MDVDAEVAMQEAVELEHDQVMSAWECWAALWSLVASYTREGKIKNGRARDEFVRATLLARGWTEAPRKRHVAFVELAA